MIHIGRDEIEVMQKALDKWGLENQIGILHEEMGELMVAISKHRRSDGSESHDELLALTEKVCEETADVIIMASQMAVAFGISPVEEMIVYKIARLAEERLGLPTSPIKDKNPVPTNDDPVLGDLKRLLRIKNAMGQLTEGEGKTQCPFCKEEVSYWKNGEVISWECHTDTCPPSGSLRISGPDTTLVTGAPDAP